MLADAAGRARRAAREHGGAGAGAGGGGGEAEEGWAALATRTQVDLKDRWRTLVRTGRAGQ
jgi:hypothetical protein